MLLANTESLQINAAFTASGRECAIENWYLFDLAYSQLMISTPGCSKCEGWKRMLICDGAGSSIPALLNAPSNLVVIRSASSYCRVTLGFMSAPLTRVVGNCTSIGFPSPMFGSPVFVCYSDMTAAGVLCALRFS
jgi:hypothetical protein